MPTTRRDLVHFGLAAGASGLLASAPGRPASAGAPQAGAQAPGFYRFKVGDIEVPLVHDGAAVRPLDDKFVRNAPLADVQGALAAAFQPTDTLTIPFTAAVLNTGRQLVMIDSGNGEMGAAGTGRWMENFRAAGYAPEQVDLVVVSHFHGDHINGIRAKDGSLVFPRARVHVPAPEHAFWMDDARMNAAPQAARGAFQNARRVFGTLPAEQLARFEPGAQVVPGVVASAAFGHTPGMCIFNVSSEGQSFHYVADVTNVPSLFARNPDWAVVFDMDPNAARMTRRRVFDSMVKDRALAGGFHFPFPAFGTMETAGSGFQFKPVA
jgi:glyoxylase-like metal-dependent hydrolase (beta-lactamase superfamily II)